MRVALVRRLPVPTGARSADCSSARSDQATRRPRQSKGTVMLAEAVSRVSRVADVAADAARDAANAVSSRAQDFVRNLAGSGASADRAPPQPANDDGSSASVPAQAGQDTRSNGVNGNNPTESPPGIRETGDAVNTLLNPGDEINKLNSDGDRVVMSMTGEGKLQIPAVRLPIGIGAKGQYGYDITVTQVGDATQGGRPPTYDVTFDKNLLGGGVLDLVEKGIDPAVELNLSATNSVTMNFDSRADATRAVGILQRAAIEQSIRDAGHALTPGISDPTDNPVVDDSGSGVPTLPTPADPIADRFAPSEADLAFLRDNLTSYTTTVGLQERANIAAKMANLGLEPRFDGHQEFSRTLTLPHDGQPGRLTYTIAGDLQATTKEKLTVGKQNFDELEIGYVPQNIVDHGRLRGEISLSWDLPPGATDRTISGQLVPEAASLSGGEGLGAPDEVSARLQLEHQTLASLAELNRTDMRRISIEATTCNPGAHAGPVVNSLLQGDLEGAFRGMGNDFTVTAQSEFVERSGVNQQHEVGVEFADVFEAKASLIGNVGRDDVIGRRTATFTGTEIADRLGGPRQPTPTNPTTPPQQQRPEQLVVVPNDGLNVRPQPSTDAARTGVLQHGTFVQPTGREQVDAQGNQWVEVRGPDVNDRPVQGWVAAEHVRPHPAGAMDGSGRINPDLEAQGYRAHTVQPGDNIWDLAR